MKIKVKLSVQTIENNLQKIERMLLYNKLSLSNICRSKRISHKTFYVMALRAARSTFNCINYINCLKVLEYDICTCNDDNVKSKLINLLYNYINFTPYNGDEIFELYKKHIKEKILLQLMELK